MDLRNKLPGQVSCVSEHYSTNALELAQSRSLPLGVVAEIFASALARKVFEDSTDGGATDIDQRRVSKFLIFEPLYKAFRDKLITLTGEAVNQKTESPTNKRRRTNAKNPDGRSTLSLFTVNILILSPTPVLLAYCGDPSRQ